MKKKLKIRKREKEILVFLLKSYNASDLKLNLAKGIRLPSSKSRVMGHYAAIIQVNKDNVISINNKELGNLKSYGSKVTPLYNELELIKKQQKEKLEGRDTGMMKNINIVLDKEIEYGQMKKIMHTASLVGYINFKFIVKGNY